MSAADNNIEVASMGGVSTIDRRSYPRSPMSAGHLSASTMSMRAKSQRKRRANQQHNSNFKAGYVPVDEEVLHRTGIRGRKRYFLWCVLVFLMFIALLNATVTAWFIYIVGMTHYGMTSIEMTTMHGRDFLRVLSDANIVSLSFNDAFLGARYKSNLTLMANDSKVNISSGASALTVDKESVTVSTHGLIVNTIGGNKPLSLDMRTFTDEGWVTILKADSIITNQVRAVGSQEFHVESFKQINIKGSRGVDVTSDGQIELLSKERGINIESQTITLDADGGIDLEPLPKLANSSQIDSNTLSYKICVCRSGLLFTVPAGPGTSCDVGPQQLKTLCG